MFEWHAVAEAFKVRRICHEQRRTVQKFSHKSSDASREYKLTAAGSDLKGDQSAILRNSHRDGGKSSRDGIPVLAWEYVPIYVLFMVPIIIQEFVHATLKSSGPIDETEFLLLGTGVAEPRKKKTKRKATKMEQSVKKKSNSSAKEDPLSYRVLWNERLLQLENFGGTKLKPIRTCIRCPCSTTYFAV